MTLCRSFLRYIRVTSIQTEVGLLQEGWMPRFGYGLPLRSLMNQKNTFQSRFVLFQCMVARFSVSGGRTRVDGWPAVQMMPSS